jgi:serine protease
MKTSSIALTLVVGLSLPAVTDAATIRVPADAATIQQAIDAAVAGDTVLVSPGTYVENITFRGQPITVVSEQGPGMTIIDGNRAGSVVTFASGENRSAVLEGFTVRNGANSFSGGGVLIRNSAPSIVGNWIVGNGACSGAGIYSYFSSPLIKGNTISRNYVYACSGASGLGVYVGGDSAAELIENVITENSGMANGGGVTLFAAGRVVLRSNVIARNVTWGLSPCTSGGGIWMVNFSQATIVNNLVVGNVAGCGGGFSWGGSTGVTTFVNNTFADNDAAEGSAIEVSGVDTRHVIYNNVIIGTGGQTAFYCRNSSSTPSPLLNTSDVFTPQGLAYGGTCLDQTGLRGNLSVDPLFARNAFGDVPGDYRLQLASPAIDAGDNAAPQIPAADLEGNPRIADGNQDGDARVDIGAYEYQYTNQPPVADAGADQTVTADGSCRAIVALDGSASSDADGDRLTLTWTGPFGTVSGATASVSLPAGTHVFTLTVHDGRGGSSSDTLVVTVVDATPPAIASATATPSVLSPANHQFVAVTIGVSASDACGGSVRCQITSVTSNEVMDGEDWVITGDVTLKLRAERSNKGTGRIYTITMVCTDAAGNSSTKTVTVTVPRN